MAQRGSENGWEQFWVAPIAATRLGSRLLFANHFAQIGFLQIDPVQDSPRQVGAK